MPHVAVVQLRRSAHFPRTRALSDVRIPQARLVLWEERAYFAHVRHWQDVLSTLIATYPSSGSCYVHGARTSSIRSLLPSESPPLHHVHRAAQPERRCAVDDPPVRSGRRKARPTGRNDARRIGCHTAASSHAATPSHRQNWALAPLGGISSWGSPGRWLSSRSRPEVAPEVPDL